jgi:hypothetical protein
MLQEEAAGSSLSSDGGAARDTPVRSALASLRVIKGENISAPTALIRQCAATLTELECFYLGGSVYMRDDATRVLRLCTRLEFLTLHYDYPPAAWLGLSQLHTLRGVSLNHVPVAALATALPRLYTLHVCHRATHVEFSVAAFYDELLPRLRSFHLEGKWPDETKVADVSPLPLLKDLKWFAWGLNKLPRPLMGARPSTLDTSSMAVADWLKAADGAGADSPPVTSPVARVRALTVSRIHGAAAARGAASSAVDIRLL